MKYQINFYSNVLVAMISLSICTYAQVASGGSFTLDQSVIAGGGGSNSTGGNFRVDGTIGQAAAGTRATVVPFQMHNGFWTAPPLAPTAAEVTISGRVRTATGRGIQNAVITITSQNGSIRSSRSSSFGYYRFEGVAVGEAYIVSISAKRFTFGQPTIVINVLDEITDLDFVADNFDLILSGG